MSPRVTVLMPVYNGLPYLREAIESVLSQTFTDFEFLIVDDASTDGSNACIRSYKDSRITLICNEQNMGQARSLNKGLDRAQGEFVARLDQDDVCLPKRLEAQLRFLESRPDVAVVCSWEHSIDAPGRRIRSWRSELNNFGEFLGLLLLGKCPIWHPSIMFRRKVVVELGGYDASYAPAEDFDLWARLAARRYNAAIVPEFLVLQRVHGDRQSIKKGTTQLDNMQRAHNNLIQTFCESRPSERVAELLRLEETFWSHPESRHRLGDVLITLRQMLKNIKSALNLSAEEFSTLSTVVYRRLGLGVKLGEKFLFLPPMLFYPIFFGLSPLLIPQVRRLASTLYAGFRQLQNPRRLMHSIGG